MTYIGGKHFWVILFSFFFFWPKIVFATITPILISPSDNSNEDKPKLVWEYSGECVSDGSCFRIEIDNSPDFTSPEKTTYTNSLSYSPQGLEQSSFYWRVKAKDKSNKWSDWSNIYKFNIGSQVTSSPALNLTQASSLPAPSSGKNENTFSIKDAPAEIDSDQEIEVNVLIKLSDKPNSAFYLKGAFKKSDSLNYFGETYSGSSWCKNNSTYSKQLAIAVNSDGKWEGKIKVRPDFEDSGFKGTGDYVFKVGRYTDMGNGPVWSNELSLKINEVEKPEPSPSEDPEAIDDEDEMDSSVSAKFVYVPPSRDYEIKIASVAGEATKSDNITLEEQTRVLQERKVNWLLIFLGVGILAGGIGFGVYKVRRG